MRADILFRDASLIDGTGAPARRGDLAVRDDRIAAMGDLAGWTAGRSIDCGGRALAPGFVDCHVHHDEIVLTDPEMACVVSQGVTTIVNGNCGFSIAPLAAPDPLPQPLGLILSEGGPRFASFAAYRDRLAAEPPSVNTACLIGHGTLRIDAVADLDRPADAAETAAMTRALDRPLDKARFLPYFERMGTRFAEPPYPLAFSADDELIGMPQRYGPFSFVVNTDKISVETAEDQGWKLFLDPAMKDRYGVLTYDNWNLIHMALTGDQNPFEPMDADGLETFKGTAEAVFGGARLLTDDLVAMNTALINGEIDAYFTGGTYTASPARLDGLTNVRAVTPARGPIDGKGGIVWIELTSLVANPDPSPLAADFLEFVQEPEICKAVGFAEGTYNPVAQMGDPDVFALWDTDELDAIQWDTLEEEMARSVEYAEVVSYDELIKVYSAAKRS